MSARSSRTWEVKTGRIRREPHHACCLRPHTFVRWCSGSSSSRGVLIVLGVEQSGAQGLSPIGPFPASPANGAAGRSSGLVSVACGSQAPKNPGPTAAPACQFYSSSSQCNNYLRPPSSLLLNIWAVEDCREPTFYMSSGLERQQGVAQIRRSTASHGTDALLQATPDPPDPWLEPD